MNAFLVLLCHTMDDLPIGLFATRAEAERFARKVDPEPTDAIRKLYRTDCSTPSVVRVVEFNGGVPVECTNVVDFDK